jgi:hypothetical protein
VNADDLNIDMTEAVDAAARNVYESYGTMKFDDLDEVSQLHARELVLPSVYAAMPKIVIATLRGLQVMPSFNYASVQVVLAEAIAQLEAS